MRLLAALVALGSLALAGPAPATLESADAIQQCVSRNRPQRSSRQTITFKAVNRLGSVTVSTADLYWQDYDGNLKALVRFSAPADLRGSALLMIQKAGRSDMFMYLPELQKVRRVSRHGVSGSMFGTDLSYEDFERLQGMVEEAALERLPDAEIDARAVYVLTGTPARAEESEYERVVSYVDQETCVALKIELFEKGDRLRKVLTVPRDKIAEHVSLERKIYVPSYLLVEDRVDETHTEVLLEDLEVDKKLPRKLFSERELIRGSR